MIDKREILEAASSFSLLPSTVEKDYVLGWILAGISSHEELAEAWVFKGGTCLCGGAISDDRPYRVHLFSLYVNAGLGH
jgi:predicted nucleotidyltransferase component of viral defense system